MIHGQSPIQDITDNRIIIGNFQSLANRPPEFFKDVDMLMVDEVHRATNNSIKYVVDSCKYVKYRIGMSGSILRDNSADYYTLIANFGPIVKKITKKQVIEKGYATDIEVEIFKLSWASEKLRKELCDLNDRVEDGEKRFRIEQKLVRQSNIRLQWICELVSRLDGNAIVFFLDIKTQYGERIVKGIKRVSNKKVVYYVDGSITGKHREDIKERMEEGNDKILVASYDTFSTGKSVKNIKYLVCVESRKFETVISQLTGRGMRLHEDKDKCVLIDIADDISINIENYQNRNYMLRHLSERTKYYEKEGFKYRIHEINLVNKKIENYE